MHADVAQRADVAVATVFAYFNTRETLIESALDEVARLLKSSIADAAVGSHSAVQCLCDMVWQCAVLVRENPAVVRVWLDWTTSIGSPFWPKSLAFQEGVIAMFEEILERGKERGDVDTRVDTSDAARIIIGESHMLALLMFEGADDQWVKRVINHYVQMTCRYVDFEETAPTASHSAG